jgi:hypothetical protein
MKKIILILLCMPVMAYADFFTGNALLSRMNSHESMETSLALGYVMGVSDAYQDTTHCSGPQVTAGQTRDVVKLYLQRNPSVRDMAAEILIMVALAEAFPCPKDRVKKKRGDI